MLDMGHVIMIYVPVVPESSKEEWIRAGFGWMGNGGEEAYLSTNSKLLVFKLFAMKRILSGAVSLSHFIL